MSLNLKYTSSYGDSVASEPECGDIHPLFEVPIKALPLFKLNFLCI